MRQVNPIAKGKPNCVKQSSIKPCDCMLSISKPMKFDDSPALAYPGSKWSLLMEPNLRISPEICNLKANISTKKNFAVGGLSGRKTEDADVLKELNCLPKRLSYRRPSDSYQIPSKSYTCQKIVLEVCFAFLSCESETELLLPSAIEGCVFGLI